MPKNSRADENRLKVMRLPERKDAFFQKVIDRLREGNEAGGVCVVNCIKRSADTICHERIDAQ